VPRLVDRLRPGFAGRDRPATATAQFSLGRLGLPVNIIAVLFGAFFLIDIGWPRAAVYGQSWYLQYFSPIFAAGCALAGIACYIRIKRRENPARGAAAASAVQTGPGAPDGAPG
jgi:hypothetical protein